jgi:hypothetical protein
MAFGMKGFPDTKTKIIQDASGRKDFDSQQKCWQQICWQVIIATKALATNLL